MKKQLPPDSQAYIDADSLVYAAAMAGQQTTYGLYHQGKLVHSVKKAKQKDQYVELVEMGFEMLPVPVAECVWQKDVVALPFGRCTKALPKLLKQWLKTTGCEKYTCFVGDPAGDENFRDNIATIQTYKGNREGREKPIHLSQMRDYVLNLPHFRAVSNGQEADDLSLAAAEAAGNKGVLVAIDKDARQVRGCWFVNPDLMKEPVYSPRSTLGYVELKSNGKMTGLGLLHLLGQMITGDVADNILGIPLHGPVKAVRALSPFNHASHTDLEGAVTAVMALYQRYYGDEYDYKHCRTGNAVKATWRDVMEENLLLLWMKRTDDDDGDMIAKFWREGAANE